MHSVKYLSNGTHLQKLNKKVIWRIIFLLNKLDEVLMDLCVKLK